MNISSKLIVATAVFFSGLTSVHAAGEQKVEAAMNAADDFLYREAFEQFIRGAEEGNLAAQRSAGMMAYYGDRLYGAEVSRNLPEARKWFVMAAKQGCEVSKFMLLQIKQASGEGLTPVAFNANQHKSVR